MQILVTELLATLTMLFAGIILTGWVASKCETGSKLGKLLGLAVCGFLILGLVISVVRGELFRLAPGAQDDIDEVETRDSLR